MRKLTSNHKMKPAIITSGDPAGIGPEITLRAFIKGQKNIIVMGSQAHLTQIADRAALNVKLEAVTEQDITSGRAEQLIASDICPVLENPWAAPPVAGKPDTANAPQIIGSIKDAVRLVKRGICSAVVTNPIAKSVLYECGFSYPGHTEFLADLDGQHRTVMMLANAQLKVVPLTIHIPLKEVSASLNEADFIATAQIVHDALRTYFGIENPRIAIAGLNPHAGEAGHIGSEEVELLAPFIETARAEGMSVTDPLSADTLFHDEARQRYDAVICMYHDQALIPVKTLDFFGSVNITLGLSFIRTSPDHGTGFDRAAGYHARADSMIAAIQTAQNMAQAKGE